MIGLAWDHAKYLDNVANDIIPADARLFGGSTDAVTEQITGARVPSSSGFVYADPNDPEPLSVWLGADTENPTLVSQLSSDERGILPIIAVPGGIAPVWVAFGDGYVAMAPWDTENRLTATQADLDAHKTALDPHGDRAYADALVAAIPPGGGEGVTTPTSAMAVVYASNYPAGLKAPAGTYTFHATGTSDQTTINAAIDAVTAAGGGDVLLVGNLFRITGPILITSGLWLHGQGPMTEIRANSSFSDAMIKTKTVDDHMTMISQLFLNGAGESVHGILLDNQNGDLSAKPTSSPDAAHWIKDLFIRAPGSAAFAGHGIIIRGNNNRASKIESCRIQDCSGCGVWVNGASDHHLQNVEIGASGVRSTTTSTTPTAPVGCGFYIDGGNSMLTQCKAFFSRHDGFFIRSARTQLTGCQAQDNYGYGYNSSGGKGIYSGCVADSNGQAEGADGKGRAGWRLNGPNQVVSGCSAFDRGAWSWQQQYGFHIQAGAVNCRIDGVTYGNAVSSILGTPNASTTVDIVADVNGK